MSDVNTAGDYSQAIQRAFSETPPFLLLSIPETSRNQHCDKTLTSYRVGASFAVITCKVVCYNSEDLSLPNEA